MGVAKTRTLLPDPRRHIEIGLVDLAGEEKKNSVFG